MEQTWTATYRKRHTAELASTTRSIEDNDDKVRLPCQSRRLVLPRDASSSELLRDISARERDETSATVDSELCTPTRNGILGESREEVDQSG